MAFHIGCIHNQPQPAHIRSRKGNILQQPLQHCMQTSCADVFSLLVHPKSDLCDPLNTTICKAQVNAFGIQQRDVLFSQ